MHRAAVGRKEKAPDVPQYHEQHLVHESGKSFRTTPIHLAQDHLSFFRKLAMFLGGNQDFGK